MSARGGKQKGQKTNWPAEIAGWVGSGSVLLAYALTLFGVIEGDSFWYAFLNLIGATGIIIITAVKGVLQSVVLNTIWAIVAIVGIVGIWLK